MKKVLIVLVVLVLIGGVAWSQEAGLTNVQVQRFL